MLYDGNSLLDRLPGRTGLAGLSLLDGLGGPAERREAQRQAVIESQSRDAGVLEAIYEATASSGFTDRDAEANFLRTLAPLVTDLMAPLGLESSRYAAEQVRDGLAAGSRNTLEAGRSAIDNTLDMWRSTDTTPYAKSLWQAALTSSLGDVASKAVIYTGAAFSRATGFNAKAIEEAYRKAAGRDAATVEAGWKAGDLWGGWIKWAAIAGAVLLGLGYVGGRRG